MGARVSTDYQQRILLDQIAARKFDFAGLNRNERTLLERFLLSFKVDGGQLALNRDDSLSLLTFIAKYKLPDDRNPYSQALGRRY